MAQDFKWLPVTPVTCKCQFKSYCVTLDPAHCPVQLEGQWKTAKYVGLCYPGQSPQHEHRLCVEGGVRSKLLQKMKTHLRNQTHTQISFSVTPGYRDAGNTVLCIPNHILNNLYYRFFFKGGNNYSLQSHK